MDPAYHTTVRDNKNGLLSMVHSHEHCSNNRESQDSPTVNTTNNTMLIDGLPRTEDFRRTFSVGGNFDSYEQ